MKLKRQVPIEKGGVCQGWLISTAQGSLPLDSFRELTKGDTVGYTTSHEPSHTHGRLQPRTWWDSEKLLGPGSKMPSQLPDRLSPLFSPCICFILIIYFYFEK